MLTDIKGFTSKTAGFSRAQTQELLVKHRELVLPVILKFRGRLVKTIGDAFLAAFDSPTDAVICGVEIQDVLKEHNAGKSQDEWIEIRIAINSGEVAIHEDGDIYGDAVNITSRLESIAEAGEVFFTEAVYLSMNKKEVPSSEIGYRQFKGIAEKIKVYRVLRETPIGANAAEGGAAPGAPAAPGLPAGPRGARTSGRGRRLTAILVDVTVFFIVLGALGLNEAGPSANWRRETKVDGKTISKVGVGTGGIQLEKSAPEQYEVVLGTLALSADGARILKADGKPFPLSKRDVEKVSRLAGRAGKGAAPGPFCGGVFVKGENGAALYVSEKNGVLTAQPAHPGGRTAERMTVTNSKKIGFAGPESKAGGIPFKMLLWALYGGVMLWRFGATAGMMVLKLRAVDAATGGSLAPDKAFLRAFFSLVSLSAAGLGYAWALWQADRLTWHDLIAGSKIIDA